MSNIPSVRDVREIIESVQEDKYRYGMMYQFLVGASISEVCGQYAPRGSDVIKTTYQIEREQIPALIFLIKNKRIKNRGKYRACAIPLSLEYEPWAQEVFDWFEKNRDKKVFNYCKRSYSRKIGLTFDGYSWPKFEYTRSSGARELNPFRSECISKIRKNNLKEHYYFTEVDLALFGAWYEPVSDAKIQGEIEAILSVELDINNLTSLKERTDKYFNKLMLYFDELGEERTSIHRQLRIGADLSRARERALNIIELVENINNMCQWNFNATFFNESMKLIYDILSECKDKSDFRSKIASLSPLFEINLEPLKILVKEPDNKRSIKLMRDILTERNITHDPKMIETWFNIQALRTMILHSKIDAKKYIPILMFFGEPPKLDPNYTRLWDNILDKFIISLKQFLGVLNAHADACARAP